VNERLDVEVTDLGPTPLKKIAGAVRRGQIRTNAAV
jgi:hypothetical protein